MQPNLEAQTFYIDRCLKTANRKRSRHQFCCMECVAATTFVSCEQALLQLCHYELKILFDNRYIIYLFVWLKLGNFYLFLHPFELNSRFILQENSLRHYEVGPYLAVLTLVLWYLIH